MFIHTSQVLFHSVCNTMRQIITVLNKEFRDGLRNRWTISITLIFLLLSVGLAYFGTVGVGRVGFTSLSTTIVSLASLAVFIIPLISLLLAYDSIVGEDEGGTLLLLMTYPLSRSQLLIGKLLGHGAILAFSALLGFGSTALLMGLVSNNPIWTDLFEAFTLFIVSAILLGLVFLSFAYIISIVASEKSKAAGASLIVWFLFVIVFDLGLMGALIMTQGDIDSEFFPYLLLLNPTDIFRLIHINYFSSENVTGLMQIAKHVNLSTTTLLFTLFLWFALPTCAAMILINRKDI